MRWLCLGEAQSPHIWLGNDGQSSDYREHRATGLPLARYKFVGRREGSGEAPIGEPLPEGEWDEEVLPF